MKTYSELYNDLNQHIHEYIEKTYPSPVNITDRDLDLLGLLLCVRDCFQHCWKTYLERCTIENMMWYVLMVMDRVLKSPLIIGTEWETYFKNIREEFKTPNYYFPLDGRHEEKLEGIE